MARKNKTKKWASWIAMILALVVAIAIGSYFVDGAFTNAFLLNYLPLIVHQIVGWTIIGGSILSFVLNLIR